MSCPFTSINNKTSNIIDQSEYIHNKKTVITMFDINQPNSQYVMLNQCSAKFAKLPFNNPVSTRNNSNATLNQSDYINNKKYIVEMLGKTTAKPSLGNMYIKSASCKR